MGYTFHNLDKGLPGPHTYTLSFYFGNMGVDTTIFKDLIHFHYLALLAPS